MECIWNVHIEESCIAKFQIFGEAGNNRCGFFRFTWKKLEHGEYVRFYLTNGLISKHVRLQYGLNY